MKKKHYKTVWISDVHLGTLGCQAKRLQKFLKSITCENLFLVGDIVDFWALKRGSKWTSDHNAVVQQIIKMSRKGTKVIYIPGNHDEAFREYIGVNAGNIELHHQYVYTTNNNIKMLIVHGDEFDVVTRYYKFIAIIGDIGYHILLHTNTWFNKFRSLFGLNYWSLSAYIKRNVKQAVNFIGNFEQNVVKHAKEQNVNAVLCGHIHHAEIKNIDDILYLNCGDWVESLTAIGELPDGTLTIIYWNDEEEK